MVALHKDLHQKLTAIDFGDEDVARLEQEAKALARSLKKKADILTEKREKAAQDFSQILMATAAPLGLPNLRFETEITPGKLTADGQDVVEFICSFNKTIHYSQWQKLPQEARRRDSCSASSRLWRGVCTCRRSYSMRSIQEFRAT